MIKGLGDLATSQNTEVGAFTLVLIPTQLLGEPCTQKGTLTVDVIALLHQHHVCLGVPNHLEDLLWTLGHFISSAPGIPDEHLEYVRIFRRPGLRLLLQRQIGTAGLQECDHDQQQQPEVTREFPIQYPMQ